MNKHHMKLFVLKNASPEEIEKEIIRYKKIVESFKDKSNYKTLDIRVKEYYINCANKTSLEIKIMEDKLNESY